MNRSIFQLNCTYLFIVPLFTLLMLGGCSAPVDDEGFYLVPPVDDPMVLSYRFVPSVKIFAVAADWYVPLDFDGDGKKNLAVIANMWYQMDTLSGVIFYEDIAATRAVEQYNIKTPMVFTYLTRDFDGDGGEDLALTYCTRDSLYLEIVNYSGYSLYKRFIATGADLDGNGLWDGHGMLCGVYDFNCDGQEEILVAVDVGYDLYPRKLICLDWINNKELWEYDVSGVVCHELVQVAKLGDNRSVSVIVPVQSKGNAAVAGDMTDAHAYLVVLDDEGELRWKKELGGIFSNSRLTLLDYDGDGQQDVLAAVRYEQIDPSDSTKKREGGRLEVYDAEGKTMHTLDLGLNRNVNYIYRFDYDGDGSEDIFITCLGNNVLIFNERLQLLNKFKCYAMVNELEMRDFIGDGSRQIIMCCDNKLWLLTREFKPLAQFGSEDISKLNLKRVFTPDEETSRYSAVITDRGLSFNFVMEVEKSPWYTIFYRNPQLAFLAAFVPLSLIIGIIWYVMVSFRRKNRLIQKQHDQLNTALEELKQTQEKLIAAEKYKQAKNIAGGFAHEIRNALFPARGAISRLKGMNRQEQVNWEQLGNYTLMADRAVSRAVALTRLISAYTKLDADYAPEPVSPGEVMAEVIRANRLALDDGGISCRIENSYPDVKVVSNRHQLYMVLNNLVLNSIDALTNRMSPVILLRTDETDDFLSLSVKDNGCGISKDNIKRIFDTFYSTKPEKGTGLGLAMVKKVVAMYGGSISVSSRENEGTLFELKLKIYQP
ncbi:MAG: ATP-binding protein [Candidatus Zixiibacteriota bacterium]